MTAPEPTLAPPIPASVTAVTVACAKPTDAANRPMSIILAVAVARLAERAVALAPVPLVSCPR